MSSDDENEKSSKKGSAIKSAIDLQRMRLEKLMKNPDKLAFIPERPKDKKFQDAPEFVRNVMGSSAGAGSGEFHVYRHIRRREYARQEYLQHRKDKEVLNDAYHDTLEENTLKNQSRTAKKRAKRHKRKEAIKAKRLKTKQGLKAKESSSSDSNSGDEETDDLPICEPDNSAKPAKNDLMVKNSPSNDKSNDSDTNSKAPQTDSGR